MRGFGTSTSRTCQGLTRRDVLRVGGLGIAGLTLADGLRQQTPANPARSRREVSCIFLWLADGPSQNTRTPFHA